jgi:16S rRNA (cytosine1402-N4)-methyltransferase
MPAKNLPNNETHSHIPVLRDEVLTCLEPQAQKCYVDVTLGAGGHTQALLESVTPHGQVIGLDQDPVALAIAEKRLAPYGSQVRFVTGNFGDVEQLLQPLLGSDGITGGLLADLGVSSMQLDTAERGFSFTKEAPLDMRMSPDSALTAETVINTYPESTLKRLFSEYGEEHLSGTIARVVASQREDQPFRTTLQLAQCIANIYGGRAKKEKIHPATRVFQALRIEVNDELGQLRRLLASLPTLLAPEARVAIISFHSLEDRLVKQFFKQQSIDCICPSTFPVCRCDHRATFRLVSSKPITASESEIARNPRSRSAKLRAAIRL